MKPGTLVLRYAAFAVAATAANLAVQRLVLVLGDHPSAYFPALLIGTATGLVLKYVLDRRWIFIEPLGGVAAHGRAFSGYTLTGVATTAIFWGSETLFWYAGETPAWRETGAIIGLSIGYVVKYRLDRRYVFGGAKERMAGPR